jgi:hypothetical protein
MHSRISSLSAGFAASTAEPLAGRHESKALRIDNSFTGLCQGTTSVVPHTLQD